MKNKNDLIIIFITLALGISTSFLAFNALMGNNFELVLSGNPVIGQIPIRIDALSAWMILIINFTFITGVLYGTGYLRHYRDKPKNIRIHQLLFVILHLSMILVCSV